MSALLIILAACALGYFIFPRVLSVPRDRFDEFQFWLNHPAAHRGLYDLDSGVAENSLAAFKAAVSAGVAIELDVRACADGLVIMHDSTLKRACNSDARVSQLTLTQLAEFRLYGTREHIPTLIQALKTVNGRVPLIIELKDYGVFSAPRLVRAIKPILDEYDGKYCLESFNPWVLRLCRKHLPNAARGQLATSFRQTRPSAGIIPGWLFSNLLLCPLSRPHFVSYEFGQPPSRGLRTWIARGGKCARWVPHTAQEVRQVLGRGEIAIFEGKDSLN